MGGTLLLVVALLAILVVVPGVNGRRTGGTADRVPIPQPPQAGQCLSSMRWSVLESSSQHPFSTGVIGSCDGDKVGEIVSVFPPDNSGGSVDDIAMQSYLVRESECVTQVVDYLGLVLRPYGLGLPGVSSEEVQWTPYLLAAWVVVGPDDDQRMLGADWLVCAVATTMPVSYEGSLRDAYSTGASHAGLGSCGVDSVGGAFVNCNENHWVQRLATAEYSDTVTSADFELLYRTCKEVVAALMRVDDPTFGGELSVFVDMNLNNGQSAGCDVRAPSGRYLNRSLIGIGDGPLPWAS